MFFYHPARGVYTFVHGDGDVGIGLREELAWLERSLKDAYEINT